ncbi:MAG: TetR/AcrR family transcriptional regulator [Legionella sp.]|nr:TetR/AcrR family transcriptional regulator [Legionella sp.]
MTIKRIVKNPEIRKAEIIQVAKDLFEKKGYAHTSIEAIIKEAQIAKGTFYYYFKTKRDILTAIVDNIASDMELYFQSIIENKHISPLEKIKLMIAGEEKKSKTQPFVMAVLHEAENRELQEELNVRTLHTIGPLLTHALNEGYKTKLFSREIRLETLQLILAGSQFVLDSGLLALTTEQRHNYLKALQDMLETILGAKSGTFDFLIP